MAGRDLKNKVQSALERIATATPTGACLVEGDRRGAVYFGLCPEHYLEAVEGRPPTPARARGDGQCAVRGCTRPAKAEAAYCPEHLSLFASMKGGALLKEVQSSTRFPRAELPLAKVRIGSFSMRPDLTAESVTELAGSIAEQGQLAPILVVPDGKGRYELVYGHRRFLAARQIPGRNTIDAQIAPAATPRKQLVALAAAENFQREWVPLLAKAAWLAHLAQDEGMSPQEIAVALSMSLSEVYRHLQYIKGLHTDVLAAYLDGKLTVERANQLLAIPEARQPALLAQLLAAADADAAKKALARAVREEERRAFGKWKGDPGTGIAIKGGVRGPQVVTLTFEGTEDLFRFYRVVELGKGKLRKRGGTEPSA